MSVARHESHIMKFFRDFGQSNGEMYFLRSGGGGAGCDHDAEMVVDGGGSGVSNVR